MAYAYFQQRNTTTLSNQIMITYKVIVSNQQKNGLKPLKPNDPGYRQTVLQRNLNTCRHKTGSRVKVRRGHKRGTIIKIETDATRVNWEKQTPAFIHVKFDDGEELFCTSGQLKASKI